MRHQLHNQADRGAVNESEGVLFPLHHNQIEFCGLIDFDSTCHWLTFRGEKLAE